jgi:hypothetical protein
VPPATEAAAYELLEQLRWGGAAPPCPRCGVAGRCFLLRPVDVGGRRTRTGAVSARRVWKCGACRGQFSVLVGTVAQGSRIPMRAWADVLGQWFAADAVPAVDVVVQRYGVSRAAARQLLRRLQLAEAACGGQDGGALLRLEPAEAARIRAATPARVRPRPQSGPTADYG